MKTIVFDLGMVLIDYRWRAFLEDMGYAEDMVDRLAKAVFLNKTWHQFDWGNMTDDEIIGTMKKDAPDLSDHIDRIFEPENFKDVCHPYDYSEDLIRYLHEQGFRLYVLSNYGNTLLKCGRHLHTFLDYMDGGVISYEVHQMKPNPDIYQTLLSKCEIDPVDAIYFDDVPANCEGARNAGILTIETHGLPHILDALEKYCHVDMTPIREKYPDAKIIDRGKDTVSADLVNVK